MRDPWFGFVLLYASLLAVCALLLAYGPAPVQLATLVFTIAVVILTFLNPAYALRRLGTTLLAVFASRTAVTVSGTIDLIGLIEFDSAFFSGVVELVFGKADLLLLSLLCIAGLVCLGLDRLPELRHPPRTRMLEVRLVENSLHVEPCQDGLELTTQMDLAAVGPHPVHLSDAGARLGIPWHRSSWLGFWYEHPSGIEVKATRPVRVAPGKSIRIRVSGRLPSRIVPLMSRIPNRFWLRELTGTAGLPVVLQVRTSARADVQLPVRVRP